MTARRYAYNLAGRQIWSPRRIWRHEPHRLWAAIGVRLRPRREIRRLQAVADGLMYRLEHPERFNRDEDAGPHDFDDPPRP